MSAILQAYGYWYYKFEVGLLADYNVQKYKDKTHFKT